MFLVHCKVGALPIMLLNFFFRRNERNVRSFRKTKCSYMRTEIVNRKSFYKGAQVPSDKHLWWSWRFICSLLLYLFSVFLRCSLPQTCSPSWLNSALASQVSPPPWILGVLGRVVFIRVKDAQTHCCQILLSDYKWENFSFSSLFSLVPLPLSSRRPSSSCLWDFSCCEHFPLWRKDLSLVQVGPWCSRSPRGTVHSLKQLCIFLKFALF